MGHVGDSRAYLFRDGEISQLTNDHTFVQGLIDEGRITEAEARVHPHRNLILRAVDGTHDLEPDLFVLELVVGDRLLLCSDGACGVLDDGRLADILSSGSPDYAAVELVRASLEAGSSDNVTCVVADVKDDDAEVEHDSPLMVGAAAELRRRGRGTKGASGKAPSLFRGHRAGDTGELEPIAAEILDSVPFAIQSDPQGDPEAARYAPRPPRRFRWLSAVLVAFVVIGLVWAGLAVAWSWTQKQYYVGEQDGVVVIYRGLDASLPGLDLSEPYETSNVDLARLSDFDARQVREGIDAGSLDEARSTVESLAAKMSPAAAEDDRLMAQQTAQAGTGLMGFVHRRRRGAELFLLVLALAVGIGAYAAVGVGVEGEVPADIIAYGGWLAGLAVAAHITVRLVAPYADPILLPAVVALNGLGLAVIHRLDLAYEARGPTTTTPSPPSSSPG